ncbi:MAG TPA: LamG-like jellyroll fold domain-containing protein, partial [Luteolibacter sp.]|nr:LamG-like jellyroll fold domain-containing protein [Luteolibacter sp.]
VTGSYIFWISAGESGELWLSPDTDRENAAPVAAVTTSSAPGEWNKQAGQQSAPVELQAGQVYYIEARHKQGWGTDHVQVAWQGPGMAEKEIIPGLWLAPDDRQFAPWAGDAALAVRDGAAAGTVVGAIPFLEPNLGQQVASHAITSGNEVGNFIIDPADGTIRVAEGASFTAGETYSLTISATDDGDPAAEGAAIATVTVRRLDEGLFAWWQLDETSGTTAFDSSGSQRNASLIGSAAWVPRAAADHALQLDGIDAGFSRYDMNSPEGLTPFTVAAWVKVPPEHDAEAVIVQQAADPVFEGPGYYRVSVTADGNVRFVVYGDNADDSDEGFQFDLVSPGTINDGQWHHVACVREGGDGRVFIDGVESAAGTGTARMLQAESTISAGYDTVSFSAYLDATVDDVRIYQEALVAAQITRIAAAPKIALGEPVVSGEIIVPEGAGLMLGVEAGSPSGPAPAIAWSLVSGPGAVVFDDPSAAATGVSFSATGTYLLRASAISGNDDVSRDISVTYGCTAITPFAGGQIGTEGAGFHTATGPGAYLISGDSPGIPDGGVSDGFYLLGQIFAGDFDVRVRVDDAMDLELGEPLGIAGLVVRAGATGATDDAGGFIGLRPASAAGTWIRRITTGAANEVSDYPGIAPSSWCRITRSGSLVEFWHSPDGGAWTSRGTMNLAGDVNVGMCWSPNFPDYPGTAYFSGLAGFSTGNLGAGVDAGPDFSAETTIGTQLSGAINDDGLPDPPAATAVAWEVLSGPGTVDIADPADPLSAVTFGASGEYALRLLADDGALRTFNDVTVTVTDPLPVLAVEATTPDAAEEGPVNGVFTITREVWLEGDLSVDFTLGGDAENILDYEELPLSVIIPDGVASVEIVVAPVADGLVEGPETVTLTITTGDYLISGADAEIAIADSNHAPEWASPVFAAGDATQDVPYSDSIAGTATDPDAGDELVFTKETGPEWLEIAPDGTLSGTPLNDDVGLNEFTARVTD